MTSQWKRSGPRENLVYSLTGPYGDLAIVYRHGALWYARDLTKTMRLGTGGLPHTAWFETLAKAKTAIAKAKETAP